MSSVSDTESQLYWLSTLALAKSRKPRAQSLKDRRNRACREIQDLRGQDAEIEDRGDRDRKCSHAHSADTDLHSLALAFRHVHHDDDAQVEEDGDHAGEHADDGKTVVTSADGGAEDVPLADEAGRRR